MDRIRQLSELTVDELANIRSTLCRRYGIGKRGHIFEIAFGVAEKGQMLDLQRRQAICFYVDKKCTPRALKDRIPAEEEVRIKRGDKFVKVQLKTDVIVVKRSHVKLTGRSIRHQSRTALATTGCAVVWRTSSSEDFRWGVLTVGHLFSNIPSVPQTTPQVRVLAPFTTAHPNGLEVEGTLLARSKRGDGSNVDAALVEVKKSHLVTAGILSNSPSTNAQKIRKISDLASDFGHIGFTFPGDSRLGFLVTRYYPEFTLIASLGRIEHVLDVAASFANTFGPGFSGTLWAISRQGACLQFAGWEVPGQPSLSYMSGSGQALSTLLAWTRRMLAAIESVPVSQMELRLVRRL